MKLCVVGGGKMAEALVGGLLATGWADADELGVIEIDATRRQHLADSFVGMAVSESCEAAVSDPAFDIADVLIAVKPQHVGDVAAVLGAAGSTRALSIAAGVPIATIQDALGAEARIVRAMPNTPALVGKGAAAIAASPTATTTDLAWAQSILEAVGSVEVVDESLLDAVTGLSGSGPAYLFLLAEAMSAAGVAQGLSAAMADALTRQTLLGASTLLVAEGDTAPSQLRANVTSPGGTTAAAISSFQDAGFESIVAEAIAAATARSVELGLSD